MTYQPIVPAGGLAGWAFLKATEDRQRAAFAASPKITRQSSYFTERIGEIDSAEELVADRQLLAVSLEAYGLGDDLDNRYFIRKILDEGTLSDTSLAMKLADTRYRSFSADFGFGDFSVPRSKLSDFGPRIAEAFQDRSFEVAVGTQQEEFRLALNAEREMADIAAKETSADGRWFHVMGSPPLRSVFETALSLPTTFGQLDLDQQLEVFRDRADSVFGNGEIAQFSDPAQIEKLVERYLVMSQLSGTASNLPSQTALMLLQS